MKTEVHTTNWQYLDYLSEGVVLCQPDGAICYLNQAARQLLGQETKLSFLHELVDSEETAVSLIAPFSEQTVSTKYGLLHARCFPLEDQALRQLLITPAQHDEKAALAQLASLAAVNKEQQLQEKLPLIVESIQQSGWRRVGISLRDAAFNIIVLFTAGFNEEERAYILDNPAPPSDWLRLFNSEETKQFKHGSCYFVPGDHPWLQQNFQNILADGEAQAYNQDQWHPNDLLCMPLYNSQSRLIGLIGLDGPANGRRPTADTFNTLELYGQFCASIIENTQLINQMSVRSRELEILIEGGQALSGILEKDVVLQTAARQMAQAINADGVTVYKWSNSQRLLTVIEDHDYVNHFPHLSAGFSSTVKPQSGLATVLENQLPKMFAGERLKVALPRPLWQEDSNRAVSVFLPVVVSAETYGLIQLYNRQAKLFSPEERQLLVALLNQANTALETALIFEDTYERERFYTALGSVSLALNYTLDLQSVLDLICSESVRIFNVDGAYIWRRVDKQFVGGAAKGHGEKAFQGSIVPSTDVDALVTQVAALGEAKILNQAGRAGLSTQLRLPQHEVIKSALGVPLEQEGSIIGVLVLVDTSNPERFNNRISMQATYVGVQAAIALQNAMLFEELRDFNEQLDARVAKRTQALNEESNRVKILLRITSELSASLDEDHVLNQALHLVNEVVNATQGVILLVNHETGEMVFRSAFGIGYSASLTNGRSTGMMNDEGLSGWVMEQKTAVIVHDTQKDPRWVQRENSLQHRSALAVPLITSDEVIGVLMLFHTRPNAFTKQQLDLVEAAAIQVASAVNNANLYQLIREQAERLGMMLREAQIETAKNQAILESIADGVLVSDESNQIMLANAKAATILGIDRNRLLDKTIEELIGLYIHENNASWIATISDWSRNADLIEDGMFLSEQLQIEDRIISARLSPVLAGRQFYGTVSIFRDITRDVELDRLKTDFVSNVSHELRTPMTSIKGYVDLMLMGAAGEMTPPQMRYLDVIKNNAQRLHMLVNDLLNISRIDRGQTTLDLRPLALQQLVEQVVEGHLAGRIQVEQKPMNVQIDVPPNLPLANADHARITQVVTNLVDNAFNYTPQNGDISISATHDAQAIYINVTDSGIGISQENQDKIFDRFFRGENEDVQKVPGTGLGLAIVNSLIEMHGGLLTIESSLGEGSTFTFSLPIAKEESELS